MKFIVFLIFTLSFQVFSCELTTSQSEAETKRFDEAMAQADHVILASVMRFYKLPSWEKGFQGAVLQTIDDLKGYATDFVDVAFLPTQSISPQPSQDSEYWPSQLNSEHLFTIIKENDRFYVTAVGRAVDEKLFRSCLKMRQEREAIKQRKQDEEDFQLPPELQVDHLAEFED